MGAASKRRAALRKQGVDPDDTPNHEFWLVQRLQKAHSNRPEKGFDGSFRCDYMGSAEFEFGAIPKSLARIREGGVELAMVNVTYEGVTRAVYFIGPDVRAKAKDFQAWLAGGCKGKESSHFPENFTGRDSLFKDRPVSDWMAETVAWWSLDDDVLFTLDETTADQLVTALNARKKD